MGTPRTFSLEKTITDMIDYLADHGDYDGKASNVIATAIRNLYEIAGHSDESRNKANEIAKKMGFGKGGVSADFFSKLNTKKLNELFIDEGKQRLSTKSIVKPKLQVELYGDGYTGLLWNFHNRILPVKIVLHIIAQQIIKNENLIIDLETAREIVREVIPDFTNRFHDMDFHLISESDRKWNAKIGFPHTNESAKFLPRVKKLEGRGHSNKTYEQNLDKVVEGSISFFVDKFLGMKLKGKKGFRGACFELGFLEIDNNSQIMLTELGRDFLKYESPALTAVINSEPEGSEIFSKTEVRFLMEKVFSQDRFGLEYIMIKRILGNELWKKPEDVLSLDSLMTILKKEQEKYIKNNTRYEKIHKRNYSLVDEDADKGEDGQCPNCQHEFKKNEERMEQTVTGRQYCNKCVKEINDNLQKDLQKQRQQRATSIAKRLVEMGLLSRQDEIEESVEDEKEEKESEMGRPKAFYRRTDLGRKVYEEILSKNS